MTAPLTLFEDVPLVSTERLGPFFEAVPIPHHYGDLTRTRVRCIKIEHSLYLVGAHPWKQVTGCWISQKKTDGFQAIVRADVDGVSRQYVSLTTPPQDDDPIVEVAGLAKMAPLTGKLIQNPDEIIEDIARLCGRELRFPLFREACNRRGLRIAGSVSEVKSLRSYVNEILESVGAKWLGENAAFYPNPDPSYAYPVDVSAALQHEIEMNDVAGSLIVYYSWNHSAERHGAYIELTALGAQYDNKGIYYAKWLRLARDAEALARRILGKRAGRFVRTRAVANGVVRAGTMVAIDSPTFPGQMLVLEAQPNEVSTEIQGEIVLETHPHMEVTQFSNENRAIRSERIDVLLDLVKKEAKVTVFDSQNRPMPDILVTYDGAVTKKTDRLGVVTFAVATGNHTLVLEGTNIENNDPYPLFIP